MIGNKNIRFAQKVLLFNDRREVLVIRFSCDESVIPKYLHGKWDFPGGGLEWEETRRQGLAREIKEEIGDIKYQIGDLIYIWDWYHHKLGGISTIRTVCALYEGKYLGGNVVLNHEHDKYRWIPIDELTQLEFHLDDTKTAKDIQAIYQK